MTLYGHKKGVFFLEVALVMIFLIALYTFITSQIETREKQQDKYFSLELEKIQTKHLCSQLLSNPGNPSDWRNVSTLALLGLKKEESSYLSSNKTQALNNISSDVRELIKLTNFEIEVRHLINGSTISLMDNENIDPSEMNYVSHTCYGMNEKFEEIALEVRTK